MIKDGSFDALFHLHFDEKIVQSNIKNRRVLRLENAFLPKETPLERAELWFTP